MNKIKVHLFRCYSKNSNYLRTWNPHPKKLSSQSDYSSRKSRIWFWCLGPTMNYTNENSSTGSRTSNFTSIECSKLLTVSQGKVHQTRSLLLQRSYSRNGKSKNCQ